MTVRSLRCTCCGEHAGRWEQHWNQDTGYGLCAKCRDWIWERAPQHERDRFEQTYGKPGVNYEAWPDGTPQQKPAEQSNHAKQSGTQ